jgi:Ser/Thr protein kinase RdoA (MazF antagonist)
MDKLGIYHNDIHAGNICATNGDNVTVHIIDLDEVSELCLMWHVQINF